MKDMVREPLISKVRMVRYIEEVLAIIYSTGLVRCIHKEEKLFISAIL
jgi:hypothetical protein